MNQTVPIVFSKDELWTLQVFVRHEGSPAWQGKWPIYSLDLNDVISEAILLCEDEGMHEACIPLSRGDCLLIDAVVPQTAKSAGGVPLGKNILLKSYRARRTLSGGPLAVLTESPDIDVSEKMSEFETFYAQKRNRRTRRNPNA